MENFEQSQNEVVTGRINERVESVQGEMLVSMLMAPPLIPSRPELPQIFCDNDGDGSVDLRHPSNQASLETDIENDVLLAEFGLLLHTMATENENEERRILAEETRRRELQAQLAERSERVKVLEEELVRKSALLNDANQQLVDKGKLLEQSNCRIKSLEEKTGKLQLEIETFQNKSVAADSRHKTSTGNDIKMLINFKHRFLKGRKGIETRTTNLVPLQPTKIVKVQKTGMLSSASSEPGANPSSSSVDSVGGQKKSKPSTSTNVKTVPSSQLVHRRINHGFSIETSGRRVQPRRRAKLKKNGQKKKNHTESCKFC